MERIRHTCFRRPDNTVLSCTSACFAFGIIGLWWSRFFLVEGVQVLSGSTLQWCCMEIHQYLKKFNRTGTVTLVGPLAEQPGRITEPVIYVDGGSRSRVEGTGLSVGDGDSFDGKIDILLNPEKNFSDLAFALEHIPQEYDAVVATGFLGGRRDHEMFNIGEAHHFLKSRANPTTIDFDGELTGYSMGNWAFHRNGLFSVAVVETTHVQMTGACRYPCAERTEFKPFSSLGLSNIGTGTICMMSEGPVFILFEDL